MRILLTGLLAAAHLWVSAATVNVSEEWGYDPTDATAFLQSALNADHAHDVVRIDGIPGTVWYTDPLFLHRNDFTLLVAPGVSVVARAGQFDAPGACLLTLDQRSQIVIEGYDAVFGMQRPEYELLNNSDARHVIQILGGQDITIRGLELRDGGGDGIHIGPAYAGAFGVAPSVPATNVRVTGCLIDNNYRRAISVVDANGVFIEHSLMQNTRGAAPQSGIGFAPFADHHRLTNIVVHHCSILDNGGTGMAYELFALRATSVPVDISVEDCYLADNGQLANTASEAAISVRTHADGVSGLIRLTRCLVEDHPYRGLHVRKDATDVQLRLKDCVLRRTGTAANVAENNPVVVELVDYSSPQIPFGGINFDEVVIEDAINRPHFMALGFIDAPYPILQDVTGRIVVVNPAVGTPGSAVDQDLGAPNNGGNQNVTLAQTPVADWPTTPLTMFAADNQITEGTTDPGEFVISRTAANDLTFPLPLHFTATGTATDRLDLAHLPLGAVIPANATATILTPEARADGLVEGLETYRLTLVPDDAYSAPLFNNGLANIVDADALLPLIWGRVDLLERDCGHELRWATYDEQNVAYFELARSADGRSWQRLDTLAATNRAINSYRLPLPEMRSDYYLRLRQIDVDGRFVDAPLLRVTPGCLVAEPVLGPNPTGGILSWEASQELEVLSVTDALGRSYAVPTTSTSIDLSALRPGVYYVRLRRNGQFYTRTVVRK